MSVKKFFNKFKIVCTEIIKMGWIYFTEICPGKEVGSSYNKAFDMFLEQCMINEEKMKQQLLYYNYYRFIIRTDGEYDKIYCSDGKVFLKSIFLKSKNFKNSLINHYGPLGIYVKGPTEILRRDKSKTNKWIIELVIKSHN